MNGAAAIASWMRAPQPKLGIAIDERAPGPGEVFRTEVPDTMRGIRFEMGRMVQAVKEAAGDPVVVDATRMVLLASRPKNRVSELGTIFEWLKAHFHYVNDPLGKEYLQTPGRMVRQTQVPNEVLGRILAPLYNGRRNGLVAKALGDCDEGAMLSAGMVASVGILPRFRFGGADGSLFHVWTQAWIPPRAGLQGWGGEEGRWVDMDVTEPSYRLGEYAPFAQYAHMEIWED